MGASVTGGGPSLRLERGAPAGSRVQHLRAVFEVLRAKEIAIDDDARFGAERMADEDAVGGAVLLAERPQVAEVLRLAGLVVLPGLHDHHIALIR